MDNLLFDAMKGFIDTNRQQGSTSILLGAMYSNPKAILVVANLDVKFALSKRHPTLNDRILTVNLIKGRSYRGMRGPILFDASAIIELIYSEKVSAPEPLDKDFKVFYNEPINANSLKDAMVKLTDFARSLSDDGYGPLVTDDFSDGYNTKHTKQLNVKMTEEDSKDIQNINRDFFEGEATNSMLGRVLLRKGIQFYKRLKENF